MVAAMRLLEGGHRTDVRMIFWHVGSTLRKIHHRAWGRDPHMQATLHHPRRARQLASAVAATRQRLSVVRIMLLTHAMPETSGAIYLHAARLNTCAPMPPVAQLAEPGWRLQSYSTTATTASVAVMSENACCSARALIRIFREAPCAALTGVKAECRW